MLAGWSKMHAGPVFLKEKEKILNMSQEEKRKRYRLNPITLDNIETWNTYYQNNSDRLKKLDKDFYSDQFSIVIKESNPHLNEIVSIWKGDITKLEVDAVVNAANNSLLGGLGVEGEIHKAAGELLYEECKILLGCQTGDAKITGGYQLPAKYIIHTVGPKEESQNQREYGKRTLEEKLPLLNSCYDKCLKMLVENDLRSIAFPCISSGIFGYPQDTAASMALKTVRDFLESNYSSVDRVIFCLFLEKEMEIYETLMQLYFPIS